MFPFWLRNLIGRIGNVPPMQRIGSSKPLRWFTREWREAKGLSQDQVAERLETNRGQISKLERGELRMNDDWIAGISYALGIEPSELLRDPRIPSQADMLRGASPDQERQIREFAEFIMKKSA